MYTDAGGNDEDVPTSDRIMALQTYAWLSRAACDEGLGTVDELPQLVPPLSPSPTHLLRSRAVTTNNENKPRHPKVPLTNAWNKNGQELR